ncbi:MAG: AAA family ATPase [Candidatus Thermoplasmatota archaeon]|nr:AAA family ATPase [Candidatus Thermoplasmatota archaeon]
MKMTKIVMKNWCSFYGSHELDFGDEENDSSFVIFGQIGKGKSSIVAAIEWVLFGRVMDTMQDGDEHILRKERPIVDAEQFNGEFAKFALPLMVDKAYREGDYSTEVEMYFTHESREYKLVRRAYPSNGVVPLTDEDMNIHLSLWNGVETFEYECAKIDIKLDTSVQPKINEIIPSEISRFFFVKGDGIREFTGLIFGVDNNPKMMDAVNSVVGLPALSRSVGDFRRLKVQSEDRANQLARKAKGAEDLKKEIAGYTIQLEQIRDGYEEDGEKVPGKNELLAIEKKFSGEISTLRDEIGEQDEAKNLLLKKATFQDELSRIEEALPDYYGSYKTNLKNGWKILIQRKISQSLNRLEKDAKKEDDLAQKISRLESGLLHEEERYNSPDGSIECFTCKMIQPELSDEERQKLKISVESRREQIREFEYDLTGVKGSGDKKLKLYAFNTDVDGRTITHAESLVQKNRARVGELNELILGCDEALLDLEVGELETKQEQLKHLTTQHILLKSQLEDAESEETRLTQLLKTKRSDLRRKTGDNQGDDLEIQVSAYKWLEDIWEKSLETYREKIRNSIDEICTQRFLEWVDQPKKYSRVETSQNWSLTVYGADDNWAPLGNPGHRQLLSVCFIESLRQNSNIEFPLIFDNPGAAVDSETISGILDYYLNNPPSQFLALSHSGGMREDEMMKKHHKSGRIKKAWRVDYVPGLDRHSELKTL